MSFISENCLIQKKRLLFISVAIYVPKLLALKTHEKYITIHQPILTHTEPTLYSESHISNKVNLRIKLELEFNIQMKCY